MARSTSAFRRNSCKPPAPLAEEIMVDEAEDESTLGISPTPDAEIVAVQQYIVYSPTFGVPVLYFTIQDQRMSLIEAMSGVDICLDGAFLPLQEIVKTSLFRSDVLPENTTTESHAIVMESSQFPLLSFGDHPVLGMACWYFHPCETARAVNEILEAGKEEAPDEHQERPERDLLLKWIEAWFLVLGTTVDLR